MDRIQRPQCDVRMALVNHRARPLHHAAVKRQQKKFLACTLS